MPSRPDVGVIVAAAGRGRRVGSGEPKQFRSVAGVPVLLRALRPFVSHPAVEQVVVALPEEFVAEPPSWLAPLVGERLRLVAGGEERMASVERALEALSDACSVVVVHDGARPFPAAGVIDAVLAEARAGRGAIAAVPVSDTLKEGMTEADSERTVVRRTVPRDGLWRAQTPQAFPRALLTRAFEAARRNGEVGTDDAALVEAVGGTVVLVPDTARNVKITEPGDFAVAEALARTAP